METYDFVLKLERGPEDRIGMGESVPQLPLTGFDSRDIQGLG